MLRGAKEGDTLTSNASGVAYKTHRNTNAVTRLDGSKFTTPNADPFLDEFTLNGATGLMDYRLAGIPDGLGAFANGDGTFTLLVNQEHGATAGVTRRHGRPGAFVSRWTIRQDTLEVLQGEDLINAIPDRVGGRRPAPRAVQPGLSQPPRMKAFFVSAARTDAGVSVTVAIRNNTAAPVNDAQILRSRLNGVPADSLPAPFTVEPWGTQIVTLRFTGDFGTHATLNLSGKSSVGRFSITGRRITLP